MNKNNHNLNAMRILGIESVNKANSGHPGIVLGAAPVLYTLFTKIMKINPKNPNWFNRDRLVLSAGHGSALLYSALHLSGYSITIEDMKNFRQLNSKTPGHPEYKHTEGIDSTTGPLGQGFAMAVGMALAENHLAAKYNKKDYKVVDHNTFVICGDGDLQEGVCQEAISFAGRYKLNKLVVFHDSNDIQLDARVEVAQSENMHLKFQAAGWNTIKVENGENLEEIHNAYLKAKDSDKPTYIEVKTVIGLGSTNQGTQKVHGAPLGDDIKVVKNYFNWKEEDFTIPKDVYKFYEENVSLRGQKENEKWDADYSKYKKDFSDLAKQLKDAINNKWNINEVDLVELNENKEQATRVSSGNVINYIGKVNQSFIGGSADLTESTKAKGADGNYDYNNPLGRNIMYGVREFAMAAINNGIALHKGLLPFCGGFFVFSDYMKPAIRLSSLMGLQALYVFTHDSIAVGEDGPTHQPIEQLAMLRSIPNINVFRPCDMAETSASYYAALKDSSRPSVIIATRQNLKELVHPKNLFESVDKGAYLFEKEENANITLIASGSEVSLAQEVKKILQSKGHKVNIVSMINLNSFERQDQTYIDSIINKSTKRFSIELASTFGWHKYLGDDGEAFGINHFGYSAPLNDILKFINFNAESIADKIILKINK
ncbi:transketolase [Spiroplasma helicoides]|uniref:Transketolase n=1 Tax=Spiroplasma helicoides TaxID=216938 RepID=A0A1B3SKR2_9MOLU|nr:transketolase [Spiroplasma helicoides]AOG60532.1 transketolase [Spiroplasma helicoides]